MVQWQTQFEQHSRNPRTPLAIAALLAILLLLTVGQLIDSITADRHQIAATITKTTSAPLPNLADLHMFGVFSSNLSNLPATTLQLTLEGTIVVVNAPKQSRALIASPNVPAKVYQVGDTLPGNATITNITKDYIVINDSGTLEKLILPVPPLLTGEK